MKGKNPFKDVRVRKAFYQAIDEEAIKTKVMRGLATPTALLIAPSLYSELKDFKRIPFDPEASKKLLAEAGYPDGFEVQMNCPNDRYVNDEAICQAVVGMLARVGVKIDLLSEPKSKFFARITAAGGYDSSFYLLGWTPSTLESYNVFQYIIGCRDEKGNGGGNNVGGYCNPKVDQLAKEALQEPDQEKRDDIFKQAWQLSLFDDVAYIPLHQQALGLGRVEEDPCRSAPRQLLHLCLDEDGLTLERCAASELRRRTPASPTNGPARPRRLASRGAGIDAWPNNAGPMQKTLKRNAKSHRRQGGRYAARH